jgi:hypothetical protein
VNLSSLKKLLTIITLTLIIPSYANAFSVFAHMAIIDASWKKSLVPLLKQSYPNATELQLKEAHSYAYGGSLVADMGYFPHGSVYFTNLVHYVRTGDFIQSLIYNSQNLDEYAFALGALSHYLTDEYGHSLATNIAEPIVYPKLAKKFGNVVTYEQDPISHSRMEFAFDVLQTARGNYASQEYHDFIDFNVSKPVLERAFMLTYGQDLNEAFDGKLDKTIASFRWAVKSLLPSLTRDAWAAKKSEIIKTDPDMTSRKFHYKIKKKEYYQKYGRQHETPGFGNEVMAFFIKIAPKIGPLRELRFSSPGPEGEKLFIKSFDTVLFYYQHTLTEFQNGSKPDFVNIDFDTGKITEQGEYGLTDQTYSLLLIKLQDKKFADLTYPLQDNILDFYGKGDTTTKSNANKKNKIDWQKTYLALQQLRTIKAIPVDSLKRRADTTKATIRSIQ